MTSARVGARRRSARGALVLAALCALPFTSGLGGQERLGAFHVQEEPDPDTGDTVLTALTPSHEDGLNVALMWRCAPRAEVALRFRRMQVLGTDVEGSRPVVLVRWWFDDGARSQASWAVASAGQRLILPGPETTSFTELATTSERVFVGFAGSAGDAPTYTFDLSGAEEALRRLPCRPTG